MCVCVLDEKGTKEEEDDEFFLFWMKPKKRKGREGGLETTKTE